MVDPTPQHADVRYEFKHVITRKAEHAGRLAVLHPVMRPKPDTEQATLLTAGAHLMGVWRDRLLEWQRVGWRYSNSPAVVARMRNCPPAFYRTGTAAAPPCNRDGFCPWCYGRRMATLYHTVAGNLTNRGEQLLVARGRTRIDGKRPVAGALQKANDRLQRLFGANLPYLTTPGGYYQVTAEPIDGDWLVTSRMLVLFPFAERFDLIPEGWKRKRWLRPTPDDIASAVAIAARYPGGLLRADAARAAQIIAAREGLKLSNYVGVFRGAAADKLARQAAKRARTPPKPRKAPWTPSTPLT